MSPVEWYYARGNKQMGPVPSSELRRLAAADELRPEDLVWREGMTEWAPARNVRGLFDEAGRAAAVADMLASATTEAPSPVDAEPMLPTAATGKRRAARRLVRHPLDALLEQLRKRFGPEKIDRTAGVFRSVGSLGLYAAMLLAAAFAVIKAVNDRDAGAVLWGMGLFFMLAVLQWAAGRFCDVLDRLNRAASCTLASTAFPDFCAIASLAAGAAVLIGAALGAVTLGMHAPTAPGILAAAGLFLFGLLVSVACGYLAAAAANLQALNVVIDPEIGAGEEAVGVSAFMLKVLLRLVPVWFGAGVVCGTLLLGCVCWLALAGGKGPEAAMLETIVSAAMKPVLIGFAALPIVAYLAFIFYCLAIDVLRAFLILPSKIDRLAAPAQPAHEPE